jgi:hypothetical protein
VSLLSRERLAIAIYPERVVWLGMGRGLRPLVSAKGVASCAAEHGSSWRGVLSVLPKVLKTAKAEGKDISIVLSNKLVRYALVPNPDSTRNRQELDTLVNHVFERIHGEVAKQWDIRLSEAAPGASALASAVDRELCVALNESVATSGGRIKSLQPYLMAAYRRQSWGMGRRDGMFVVVEPGRLCQLGWRNRGWSMVRQMHVDTAWRDTLEDTLSRSVLDSGSENPGNIRLCAMELSGMVPHHGRWPVETRALAWPGGLSPVNDRPYAGAMLAL